MEVPELSLASSTNKFVKSSDRHHEMNNISSSSQKLAETNCYSRKRKLLLLHDHHHLHHHFVYNKSQTSDHHHDVDLQLKDPLPLDWEQCLDLQVSLSSLLSPFILAQRTDVLAV